MSTRLLSRREFLARAAALGGAAALAACAPAAPAAGEEAAEAPAPAAAGAVTLTMWKGPHKPAGDETKLCARPTLDKFEAANPGIKVDFMEQPWGQY